MNKICTSLEQSQKLIELGIDIDTADMCYINGKPNIGFLSEEYKMFGDNVLADYWPAWSLSALLGLMPTDNKKDEYYVDTESHSDYHTVSYRNCWDGCIHSEYSEESLLDAAFKMVVWLKENGKI